MAIDRYRVNDALAALASDEGKVIDDDTLNDLTHQVADAIDAAPEAENREEKIILN